MARKLLLLIALLATLVVLGSWDNRRQMQRVLAEGYATTAQVTGAQYQRNMPLAADGWWPRLVEQEISVDLGWQGRDGKAHTFRKVPISDSLARGIVNGDQVRLATLPVKVLDDGSAVPVITSDVGPRLASLQTWLTVSGCLALAGWVGFAALTLFERRAAERGLSGGSATGLPPSRLFIGLAALAIGGFLAFSAWSENHPADAIGLGGEEVAADIVAARAIPSKDGGKTAYTVQLSWKDSLGAVHHFGPTVVSEAFWGRITQNGELTVKQTAIRYRPGDPQIRPVIVDDAPVQRWQSQVGMGLGLFLIVFGLALLSSALRHMRNVPAKR